MELPELQYLSAQEKSKLKTLTRDIQKYEDDLRVKEQDKSQTARGSKSALCNKISSLRKRMNAKIVEKDALLQKAEISKLRELILNKDGVIANLQEENKRLRQAWGTRPNDPDTHDFKSKKVSLLQEIR